jgi:hypothetical protein
VDAFLLRAYGTQTNAAEVTINAGSTAEVCMQTILISVGDLLLVSWECIATPAATADAVLTAYLNATVDGAFPSVRLAMPATERYALSSPARWLTPAPATGGRTINLLASAAGKNAIVAAGAGRLTWAHYSARP